ncbi:hypothetical protein BGX34_010841 [Mortierella sp. NVP85]|nr:hypothetical protein BGX34_010841 [Mortierella sp. NVP85]
MHFKTIATFLAVAGLATAQTAELKTGKAHIQQDGPDGLDVFFNFNKVAEGVNVTIAVKKGLTKAKQILSVGYEYHVHVYPVGPNNNCTATGGHLDPANVGPAPCNPQNLTSCQVGDLSGKHGNFVAGDSAEGALPVIQYVDTQLAFTGTDAITGRSVVIHNNGTRIGCADIIVDGYTAPTPSGGAPSGSAKPSPTTGSSGAIKLVASVAFSGVIAVMMMAL